MPRYVGHAQVEGESKPRSTKKFSTEEKAQTALDTLVKNLELGGYVVINSRVLPQGETPTFSANAEAGAAAIEADANRRFESALPAGEQPDAVDAPVVNLDQGKR